MESLRQILSLTGALFLIFISVGCNGGSTLNFQEGIDPDQSIDPGVYFNLEDKTWHETADHVSLQSVSDYRLRLTKHPYILLSNPKAQAWRVAGSADLKKELQEGKLVLVKVSLEARYNSFVIQWKEAEKWYGRQIHYLLDMPAERIAETTCNPSTAEKALYWTAEAFLYLESGGSNQVTGLNCEADLSAVLSRLGF